MNDTWLLVVCRVWCWWPCICISSEEENLTLSSDCLATVRGLGYVQRWWSGWIRLSHSPIARILGIIILVVSGIWYTNGNVVSQKSRHEWVRHWELSTNNSVWFPVWLLLVPVLHFPHNLFAVIRLLQLCRVVCHSFSPVDVSGPVPT